MQEIALSTSESSPSVEAVLLLFVMFCLKLNAAVGLVGVLLHQLLFIHGEWHIQAPVIAVTHVACFMLLSLALTHVQSIDLDASLIRSALAFASYCTSLFLSIAIYRLAFHPLTKASIPGPFAARLTKLWHMWKCRSSTNHLLLESLRQKYGDFVRTVNSNGR